MFLCGRIINTLYNSNSTLHLPSLEIHVLRIMQYTDAGTTKTKTVWHMIHPLYIYSYNQNDSNKYFKTIWQTTDE